MSTYINGFILDEGTDPFALARKAREVFLPRMKQKVYNDFVLEAMKAYDLATYSPETRKVAIASFGLEAPKSFTFWRLMQAVKDTQKKTMQEFSDNYETRLGFLPDPETGRILCVWFGSRENREIFEEFEGISEFSYWNSTEHPDDLTDEEWEEREAIWDRAFLPSGHIQTSTLMSQVASPVELSLNVAWEAMEKAGAEIPSRETRIKELVQHFIAGEWIKSQADPTSNFSGMMRALRDEERISHWTAIVDENLSKDPITFELLAKNTWEDIKL